MNQKALIITISVVLFLSIGTAIGSFTMTSSKYNTEISQVQEEQEVVKEKLNEVKSDKDINDHLPSDVVKFFINEVKSGEINKAKLYLSQENQGIDVTTKLDFDVLLDELIIKDVTYEKSNGEILVKLAYGTNADEVNSVKYFTVMKIDSVWKIIEIKEG